MHQFDEHHPELKGFSAFYDAEIFPMLESRDLAREKAVRRAKNYSFIVSLLGLAFFGYIYFTVGDFGIYFVVLVGCIVASISIFSWQLNLVKGFTKDQIVGGICSYVGWSYSAKPPLPQLGLWSSLMLIKKDMWAYVEDEISGEAHGAAFKSLEVELTWDRGDKVVTEFRGQLMSIAFPRKFMGRTIVLRDKGFLQSKKKSDMKRVGLVDPVFEKIFQAYGTDQVEARYLLTPVFMQTLVDLENSVNGKNIRFGFSGNQLFIAVETEDRFEAGSMFEPLTSSYRTQKILDEIGAVYDVVDVVSRAKRG